MSVTIWQDDNFSGYLEFSAGYGDTPNLSDHWIGYTGLTWNDQVSSLHSTTPLYVFEDSSAAGDYAGDYALLPAGYHNLGKLEIPRYRQRLHLGVLRHLPRRLMPATSDAGAVPPLALPYLSQRVPGGRFGARENPFHLGHAPLGHDAARRHPAAEPRVPRGDEAPPPRRMRGRMAATTLEPAARAPGPGQAPEQASALDRALGVGRRAIVPIGLFSMAFNLLGLAVPLYTMQIYDRVLPGGSRETLLYLVLAAVGRARGRGGARRAARRDRGQDRRLARAPPRPAGLHPRDRGADEPAPLRAPRRCATSATLRGFITGPTPFTLCDALWTPVYLAVVFLLHPWLGFVALVGARAAGAARARQRAADAGAARGRQHARAMQGMRRAEAVLRNAEVVIGMGMGRAVTAALDGATTSRGSTTSSRRAAARRGCSR